MSKIDTINIFKTDTTYPTDRYEYIRKIVDGSNSKLYVAYDNKLDKHVVIKRLPINSNWYNELNILKILKDVPDILSYTDHYTSWKYSYIITDYSGTFNVDEYVELNAPYSEKVANNIFVQMLKCVKNIHDRGIAHLDIKCDNFVMVSSKEPKIMLIDFGHSEIICPSTEEYLCRYGTSLYLCPEGYKYKYGFSSDIWSLGICYHLLLTGCYPFDGVNSSREYKKNVLEGSLKISDNISIQAKTIIKMILYKEPKLRPNVNQLLECKYFANFL